MTPPTEQNPDDAFRDFFVSLFLTVLVIAGMATWCSFRGSVVALERTCIHAHGQMVDGSCVFGGGE